MKALITLLLFVSLCFANKSEWKDCDTFTDATKGARSLLFSAQQESNRRFKERALGLEEESLEVKKEDSKFDRSIKEIVSDELIHYGLNKKNRMAGFNVPSGMKTMCSTRTVNYYYDNLNRTRTSSIKEINHFAKKYSHDANKQRKGAIFLLQGGPGSGGEALEPVGLQLWSSFNGEYDIVIPDHRGTARSSAIVCDAQYVKQMVNCQARVNGYMDGYTTDDAAMDTITLMQEFKALGGEVLLYGVSYGTFVSERIINLVKVVQPDLISAVVLDGICGGEACDFGKADRGQEATAYSFFDYCSRDEACSRLGKTRDEVMEKLSEFYLTKNDCTKIYALPIKSIFSSLLQDQVGRLLIPAIIHRSLRCNWMDGWALPNMFNNFVDAQTRDNQGHVGYPSNTLLNVNIGISELRGRYANQYEAETYARSCKMCSGGSKLYPEAKAEGFKTYPESKFASTPVTDIPVLLLNGDLDPQTSIGPAEAYFAKINATVPQSKFVKFPGVVHYTVGRSPMVGDEDGSCGYNILVDFFRNKNLNTLDTSCTSKLLGVPFGGYSYTHENVAYDMYDGIFGFTRHQKVLFIVFTTLGGVAVLVVLLSFVFCCLWLNDCFKRKTTKEERVKLINRSNTAYIDVGAPSNQSYYSNQ
ncbi:hypothetical protein AKO1_006242 [Acrasis kona]|uniref:Uncharacterized protein n=1 Tax=Acrasis kona TaxID=1008807 RepID=A0AAW2YJQ2_9EUKA